MSFELKRMIKAMGSFLYLVLEPNVAAFDIIFYIGKDTTNIIVLNGFQLYLNT